MGPKGAELCELERKREEKTGSSWAAGRFCTFVKTGRKLAIGSHNGAFCTKGGQGRAWWKLGRLIGNVVLKHAKVGTHY
jgi:hypothetical protein